MNKMIVPLAAAVLSAGCTAASPENNKSFLFFNIVPCQPGEEKQLAAELVELRDRTGIDTMLYSLTLHPEGFPAFSKVERLTASYRKLREELKSSGINPGILLQSVLGHWPRVDKNEEPWTRTVNCDGATSRFCPLDERYRKYIFDMVVLLAKENPCFIMSDDDVRAFSPKAECFCALHTAEFNKRTGNHFTPDEYRKAVCESNIGDPVFTAYEKLRRDTVDGVTALIREAIDSVNPAIPSGTCMPGAELIFNGTTAKAMAGKNHKPVMRIANAMYFEGSAKAVPYNVLRSQALRDYFPDIPQILDESDTCPHNLYSRAAQSMHVKLGTSIFCGLTGSKIWYVNCHKLGFPVNRKYTDILAKYRNWYQVLTREVVGTQSGGVAIPCFKEPYKWHPVAERRTPETNLAPHPVSSWESSLGVYGIPFHAEYDYGRDQLYLLAGKESVDRLNDVQLKQLLSRRVLIDGPAAAELTARGFAELLGVKAELKDFRFNRELVCKDSRKLNISKMTGVPFLTVTGSNAEVLTELCYSPYGTSPDLEKVAPGTVFFENKAGGKIIVSAFFPGSCWTAQNEGRKQFTIELLDKLNGTLIPVSAVEAAPILLMQRQSSKGMLLMAVSLGYDPLENIQLRMAQVPEKVEFLTPEGVWKKIDFTVSGNVVTLHTPLYCYHSAVFRFL